MHSTALTVWEITVANAAAQTPHPKNLMNSTSRNTLRIDDKTR